MSIIFTQTIYYFQSLKDFEYFEVNANDFDFDAHIEFGTNREKKKWVVIFAGWKSLKSRIAERKLLGLQWKDTDKKIYVHHTENQWKNVRYGFIEKIAG